MATGLAAGSGLEEGGRVRLAAGGRLQRAHEEESFVVQGLDEVQAYRLEEGGPVGGGRQVILADGSGELAVERIEVCASRQVQDEELPSGFEEPVDLSQGCRRVPEVREGVETEHHIEKFSDGLFHADIQKAKLRLDAAVPGAFEHGRGEVGGHDTSGLDAACEPAGDLSGAAAQFEQVLAGFEVELRLQGLDLFEGGDRAGAGGIPGGGEAVEELDPGIRGGVARTVVCHNI